MLAAFIDIFNLLICFFAFGFSMVDIDTKANLLETEDQLAFNT